MTSQLDFLVESHLKSLVNEMGPRPGGSDGNHKAAGYIAQSLGESGWQVEQQRFACPRWEHQATHLLLDGRALEAAANAYSPPVEVSAPAAGAGTLAELRTADLRERLAVLYGALVPGPLSPKSWFLLSDEEREIISLLEEKEPAAVLTVQQHRGGLERLIEDWEFRIPSATITPSAALALLENEKQQADLHIVTKETMGFTANIVGRSPAKPRTVSLMAHFDTKFDTPGALDNASGAAALLALGQILDLDAYPFALELVAFANEEYLPIGDEEYLRRRDQVLDDVILAINMDSIGQRLAANSIATFSTSTAFEANLKKATSAYPHLVWVDPWPQSNHSTFAMRGVPAVAFSSTGRMELAHWPDDDLRWLDSRSIAEVAVLLREILELVAGQPENWTRAER